MRFLSLFLCRVCASVALGILCVVGDVFGVRFGDGVVLGLVLVVCVVIGLVLSIW